MGRREPVDRNLFTRRATCCTTPTGHVPAQLGTIGEFERTHEPEVISGV
jgi:hypothetical protein